MFVLLLKLKISANDYKTHLKMFVLLLKLQTSANDFNCDLFLLHQQMG